MWNFLSFKQGVGSKPLNHYIKLTPSDEELKGKH